MKVFIYERNRSVIADRCEDLLKSLGVEVIHTPQGADFGIAPWLNTKIPDEELSAFKIGVLIFHPSLLPIYRGKNAIKDAFYNGDSYTGVTWFWANSGFDKGDICEQAVIPFTIEVPREFYNKHVIQNGVELLGYAVKDILKGHVRRRPQK